MASIEDSPFFVLGSQRSGTTMLRLMLNRHPRLAVPHESKFMMAFHSRLRDYGDLAEKENAARLLDDIAGHKAVVAGELITDKNLILARDVSTYPKMIDAIMSEKAKQMGKPRWGDKTPYYITYIDEIWKLFPQSKIVHLVRDGRDVVVSQRNIEWMSNNLPRLAHDWWWKTMVCHKVGSVRGPDWFLEVRYEDLVVDTENTLRIICDFLGEEFAPQMMAFNESATESVPIGSQKWHQNSVRAPEPAKLAAWKRKLSIADRIIFEENAGPALDLFGYEREHLPSTFASRVKNIYYATMNRW